ncbi:hypothetical protein NLX83_29150 [Allokutzneria sp. A3M-2-11 16]|uniref:hypothetical protein n=1 Tax=Allokutzneria sp. A3M-2-11 16 TaxID=2962043 RepID=UPI0020B7275C|nr:hypothetical protein [Allokutzneria sp. A3M-2-11 16]MCP3803348.1 hypothetical protein [Allokutzneria sp. A3M-2-11 16]
MGGSGWSYRTAFHGDVSAALISLRHKVFAAGDYFWPDSWGPRPASLDELLEDEGTQEAGTHSIIDVHRVIDPDQSDGYFTVRPLTPAETQKHFGTDEPTPEQFDHVDASGELSVPHGWSARCVPLFTEGGPTEIGFWGSSGD